MIKEYVETCNNCKKVVSREGVACSEDEDASEFCSCGCDPRFNMMMITFRNNHYDHRFAYIKSLVEEAKKDFPQIEAGDISVVHFGGDRYRGTWGVEFYVTEVDRKILEGYRRRLRSEFLL